MTSKQQFQLNDFATILKQQNEKGNEIVAYIFTSDAGPVAVTAAGLTQEITVLNAKIFEHAVAIIAESLKRNDCDITEQHHEIKDMFKPSQQ